MGRPFRQHSLEIKNAARPRENPSAPFVPRLSRQEEGKGKGESNWKMEWSRHCPFCSFFLAFTTAMEFACHNDTQTEFQPASRRSLRVSNGKIHDFGALEVQAVYISGNVRNPFEAYMRNCAKQEKMNWLKEENYPKPDFLSSSRKRLAPQLIYKGGILNAWNKKTAVALDKHFFATLPALTEVSKKDAEMAWLVYDFKLQGDCYKLGLDKIIYTQFAPALDKITRSRPGKLEDFMDKLQGKLDEKLDTPPTTEDLQAKLGK